MLKYLWWLPKDGLFEWFVGTSVSQLCLPYLRAVLPLPSSAGRAVHTQYGQQGQHTLAQNCRGTGNSEPLAFTSPGTTLGRTFPGCGVNSHCAN